MLLLQAGAKCVSDSALPDGRLIQHEVIGTANSFAPPRNSEGAIGGFLVTRSDTGADVRNTACCIARNDAFAEGCKPSYGLLDVNAG